MLKRKALFLFAKNINPDFCFFQECHSVASDVNFWKAQWGNSIWFSHGSEHSAGVMTLKHRFKGNIIASESDLMGHYICQVFAFENHCFICANIYGYNNKQENDRLFHLIEIFFFRMAKEIPQSYNYHGRRF